MRTIPIFQLFFLIALITINLSCQRDHGDLPCIDVRKNYPEKEIFLTDIADVSYLHLNSDDENYLYSGTIRAITANTVVVANTDLRLSGDILFFDRNGQPKSRLNRKGNGPEEYRNTYQVFYDEEADDVFVKSMGYDNIQVYSSAGIHKREISIPQGAMIQEMVSLDDHSLFFYDASMAAGRSFTDKSDLSTKDYFESFYLISKVDGEVLDYLELSITPVDLSVFKDGFQIRGLKNRLLKSTKGVLLCNPENDTVFLYGNDRYLTPVLCKTPLAGATNPITYINNCVDIGNYQFMDVLTVCEGDPYPGIFPAKYYMRNKRTGEIHEQKLLLQDYIGKEFVISTTQSRNALYGDKYVFELDLSELKKAYTQNKLSGKLRELVAPLKDDENNVFVIVEF